MSENMFNKNPRKGFKEDKDRIKEELIERPTNPFFVEEAPRKDRISLTIDENINDFLNKMCSITKMSRSETINMILKDYIKTNNHVRELVEIDEELQQIYKTIDK